MEFEVAREDYGVVAAVEVAVVAEEVTRGVRARGVLVRGVGEVRERAKKLRAVRRVWCERPSRGRRLVRWGLTRGAPPGIGFGSWFTTCDARRFSFVK